MIESKPRISYPPAASSAIFFESRWASGKKTPVFSINSTETMEVGLATAIRSPLLPPKRPVRNRRLGVEGWVPFICFLHRVSRLQERGAGWPSRPPLRHPRHNHRLQSHQQTSG